MKTDKIGEVWRDEKCEVKWRWKVRTLHGVESFGNKKSASGFSEKYLKTFSKQIKEGCANGMQTDC